MTQLRFALCQIDTCVGTLNSNTDKILQFAHKSAALGARVAVFPEMTLTGYPIEDLALRATFRTAAWRSVEQLATTLQEEGLGSLYVVVGTVGTQEGSSKPLNRLVVLHEGKIVTSYDKHFLPNYGVFDEFRIFASGNETSVLDIDGVRLGFAICEDIWQDGGPVEKLSHENIDVLVTINGSPFEEGKTHTRHQLAARRAREVDAPVMYVNQVGGQDDLIFDGASFVCDRDGSLLVSSPSFDEDVRIFDFDSALTSQQHGEIAPVMQPDEQVYCACVLGLRDYMRKNGFTSVTLGLSGGIDSALVAAMAADACGGENIWGISMPSKFSSQGSKDDARDVAERLGAHYEVQPIEPMVQTFLQQFPLHGIAQENLQARVRGVLVMASSNERGALALATGNKSELACGYSTIYGDAVGGYAPIKDVFKTRVWQLSRWRNAAAESGLAIGDLPIVGREQMTPVPAPNGLIPEASIEKEPSAELREGQKDSDSLPRYELLDKVLAAYIEHAHGREDLLADGFDEATVDTVMRLVDRAEWKRRQYPLGPKVSALAFGRDRRLPVTSGFRE